jgi:Uma2 family endonuclease
MPVQLLRRRFTVDDYYRMMQAGIFTEDDRLELIDGEIVEMTAIGSRHADCVNRLTRQFIQQAGERAVVSVQNPVRLSGSSEPQPDVAVLRPGSYASRHPGPEDILLLIEVADTTGEYDRSVKLPLYARGGVPEVWIVDLESQLVEAHTDPRDDGYQTTVTYARGHKVSPGAFPDLSLDVGVALGSSWEPTSDAS